MCGATLIAPVVTMRGEQDRSVGLDHRGRQARMSEQYFSQRARQGGQVCGAALIGAHSPHGHDVGVAVDMSRTVAEIRVRASTRIQSLNPVLQPVSRCRKWVRPTATRLAE